MKCRYKRQIVAVLESQRTRLIFVTVDDGITLAIDEADTECDWKVGDTLTFTVERTHEANPH